MNQKSTEKRAKSLAKSLSPMMVLAGLFAGLGVSLVSASLAAGGKQGANKPNGELNGNPVTPQQAEFFETRIRPLLFEKCFGCHSAKAQQGGLRLDSLDGVLKGGGGGPAVIPSNIEKSHLIAAVRYTGTLKMPPSGKLKDDEINALTEWVKMGAPWPGAKISNAALAAQKGEFFVGDALRNHWAFLPVKNPTPPAVKNTAWTRNPIDRFILAKLEEKGLAPAPAADRRTLIRRASFDLIGLPPSAEEVDAFVQDKSPNAWEKVVDRLLNSPRYGERWARHWLDVARYADTKGYVFQEDAVFHNAYTYRDYVINAFNSDKRYDRFIVEQLAADLAYPEDRAAQAAMGYITLGRRFLNDRQLINDDRIDTTCRGMMAITVACARCHDHKFDPISVKDYYALYSVFNRSDERDVPIWPVEKSRPYEQYTAEVAKSENEKNSIIRLQVTRLRDLLMKSPAQIPANAKSTLQSFRIEALPNPDQLNILMPLFEPDARNRINAINGHIADLNKNKPPVPELGMALHDNGNNEEQRVFIRGNQGNRGDVVPRKFLTILSQKEPKPYAPTGSGRLELARYIASSDNPLTGRVFVNRVWLYHFAQGIVRTPSDFGVRGEKPTHPELLDWLTYQFTHEQEPEEGKGTSKGNSANACGWSVKKLHRLILTSNTYQMSSDALPAVTKKAFIADPENRLLWRQNRQRLDLESMRDSLLAASGKLDTRSIGGPAVELTTMPYTTRRTIYGFVNRNNLQGLYRTFDFATPDSSAAQRINTSIPQQSLFLMNSPFVVEQAQALSRIPEIASLDDAGRVKTLYRRLFGRVPTAEELTLGIAFLKQTAPAEGAELRVRVSPWQYGWGEYDPKSGKVTAFNPFSHFTGQQWQGSATFPEPNLEYLSLSAQGGASRTGFATCGDPTMGLSRHGHHRH